MRHRLASTIVAAEFVPDGDPFREDKDDAPRPAGTYVTVRLHDGDQAIVGGNAVLEYEHGAKKE